jgi:5-methylcytosine-specific restriction enzyme A
MNLNPFILNNIYKRTEINKIYGGSYQAGISTSAKFPYIFIFSSDSGHQHGYKDEWVNPNVFSYTGEGQLNDMRFIKGNLALKDHIQNGKRIFLFVQVEKAYIRFEAELELIDFDFFNGLDREGKHRIAIKFFFKRKNKEYKYLIDEINVHEDEVPPKNINIPNETERKGLVTSRVGQGAYRKSILFRWEFKCAVTGYSKNEILIASHIVPWKGSSNEERLDVDNGILLSPTYDALFDKHLISFQNNGKIILSDSLIKTRYQEIGITGLETIKKITTGNHNYLEKHREILK